MCGDISPESGASAKQNSQDPSIVPFSDVIKFHGHLCPGVTLGYCAAKVAIRELKSGRDVDEQLVAIVENDACGLDAIQMVTGCTIGKGNLIFQDHGKQVFTFINRVTKDAVRVSLRDRENKDDPALKALREKVWSGKATPEESRAMRSMMQAQVDRMLIEPPEEYFDIRHVTIEIPEKARLFRSVKCSKCGEMVAESRARVQDGGFVCIPCFNEYTRGW